MKPSWVPLWIACLVSGGPAEAVPRPHTPPVTSRAFRYEAAEIVGGVPQTRYRVAFDLLTSADGSIDAVVRTGEHATGNGSWQPVTATATCLSAMHAPAGALARVRLWPAAKDGDALGPTFLDSCAPSALFYPLTDIMNVAMISASPGFKVAQLKRVGDVARFQGFSGSFDRNGRKLQEDVDGGTVTLISLEAHQEVVDWTPDPARLRVVETPLQGAPLTMQGSETWTFRVTLDRRTRALVEARVTNDDIDMIPELPGVPAGSVPHVKIKRIVTIEPE